MYSYGSFNPAIIANKAHMITVTLTKLGLNKLLAFARKQDGNFLSYRPVIIRRQTEAMTRYFKRK